MFAFSHAHLASSPFLHLVSCTPGLSGEFSKPFFLSFCDGGRVALSFDADAEFFSFLFVELKEDLVMFQEGSW
jgi:hypothetical protein